MRYLSTHFQSYPHDPERSISAMTLKIWSATCGTIAFPPALIDSFRHLGKVIPSSLEGSPSFREQSGATVGQSVQSVFALLRTSRLCPPYVRLICSLTGLLLSIPIALVLAASLLVLDSSNEPRTPFLLCEIYFSRSRLISVGPCDLVFLVSDIIASSPPRPFSLGF